MIATLFASANDQVNAAMSSPIDLDYVQVSVAVGLILGNGLISVLFQLGLEKRLFIASVRTILQLFLLGLVLQHLFNLENPWLVLGLAAVMAIIAGIAAVGRTQQRYAGIWLDTILSVWLSSWLITGLALTAVVQVDPWYRPQYAIPLLGMILGNTLNGISLGLDRFGEELLSKRAEVESLLALGATRWEAARRCIQRAVRTGMIPVINSMMVVGIVSLPGMMTGQLLSGVDPAEAVKYQIVIMFLIASATALGTVGVVLLSYRRAFNSNHQFIFHRLRS